MYSVHGLAYGRIIFLVKEQKDYSTILNEKMFRQQL